MATARCKQDNAYIEDLVFCGIALGVPNAKDPTKHVRLGDVVVIDRKGVINSTFIAKRPEGDEVRSQLPPPPARFLSAVNQLETEMLLGTGDWWKVVENVAAKNQTFIRPDPNTDILLNADGGTEEHPPQPKRQVGRPLLHRGSIASSNILVKDGKFRDEEAAKYGVIAMEMEGAGATEASWAFGKYAMVVRGISDYGAGKNDTWHAYASLVAAAATVALIERV